MQLVSNETMQARFSLDLKVTVACSQCKNTFCILQERLTVGQSVPVFSLPNGWVQYGEYLFCPDHEIQMNIICDRRVLDCEIRNAPEGRKAKEK